MSTFSDAPDGDSGKGAKIFKTKCAQCHVVSSLLYFHSCTLYQDAGPQVRERTSNEGWSLSCSQTAERPFDWIQAVWFLQAEKGGGNKQGPNLGGLFGRQV